VVTARAAAKHLRADERQAPQGAETEAKALQRAEDDALAAYKAAKAQRVLQRKAWDRDHSNGLWQDAWLAMLADDPLDEERDARHCAVRRAWRRADRLAEHAANEALDVLEAERNRLDAIERAAQAQRNIVAAEAATRDLHLDTDTLRRSRQHNFSNIEKTGLAGGCNGADPDHYDTAIDIAKVKVMQDVGERKRWQREVASMDEMREKSKNDFFGWLKAKGNGNKANYFKYQQWIVDQYALFEKTFRRAHKNAFKILQLPEVGPDDDVDEVFMVFAQTVWDSRIFLVRPLGDSDDFERFQKDLKLRMCREFISGDSYSLAECMDGDDEGGVRCLRRPHRRRARGRHRRRGEVHPPQLRQLPQEAAHHPLHARHLATYGGLCGMPACGQAVGCGVCDTPEELWCWCGAAGLCARVRACAGAAKYLHTYIHTHVTDPSLRTMIEENAKLQGKRNGYVAWQCLKTHCERPPSDLTIGGLNRVWENADFRTVGFDADTIPKMVVWLANKRERQTPGQVQEDRGRDRHQAALVLRPVHRPRHLGAR